MPQVPMMLYLTNAAQFLFLLFLSYDIARITVPMYVCMCIICAYHTYVCNSVKPSGSRGGKFEAVPVADALDKEVVL